MTFKRKTAKCISCDHFRTIYAKKMCSWCYDKQRKKTPLKKTSKPIKKFSKTSLDKLRRYRKVRDKYLEENPICQYPRCKSKEVTLHHKAGRLGAYLTDKRFFSALCWPHHQYIETHPEESRKLGFTISRLSNINS